MLELIVLFTIIMSVSILIESIMITKIPSKKWRSAKYCTFCDTLYPTTVLTRSLKLNEICNFCTMRTSNYSFRTVNKKIEIKQSKKVL